MGKREEKSDISEGHEVLQSEIMSENKTANLVMERGIQVFKLTF
jgi:hypothetical protein